MAATAASPPLIVLTGPTAAGKSAVAMAWASRVPLELVSMDSALVYRGMDIGTAKPTSAERAAVPHHLIDILDPTQAYSAARFVSDTQALVAGIRARGRMPLLVGGTLLYLKALRDGLDSMPASDPSVRATLDAEAAALGWPAMHAQLMAVDPVSARRLAPHDAQRIQRALEVWRLSGRALSSFHGQARSGALPLRVLSLEPDSRAWLHARIAERFDTMLSTGFVDEVRQLRARGDLDPSMPSMRCVGYRQAWQCLDADDLSPLREQGIAATRQLAKRQLTWLRSMTERTVVPCDAADATDRALQLLARWHEQGG